MSHVVDAGPLVCIQLAGQIPQVAGLSLPEPLIVTGGVWDELTVDAQRTQGRAIAAQAEAFLQSVAQRKEIAVPSAEANSLARLQGARPGFGKGESETIAYAFHNPGTTVVMMDRKPAFDAIEHLKGRVLGLYGFLDFLMSLGLSRASADAVSKEWESFPPPLWW